MQGLEHPIFIKDLGMHYATPASHRRNRYGVYKCACGKEFTARTSQIKEGSKKSCGCLKTKRLSKSEIQEGLTSHPLYSTWSNMLQRCTNPAARNFKYYGGKGITISKEWLSFSQFITDMFPTYKEDFTIDRIDSSSNYSKSNCRWATKETQARNTVILQNTNTSGYRGVTWNKSANKWQAGIVLNYKYKYLGVFEDPLEAAGAYDSYVIANNLEHTINCPKSMKLKGM